MPKSSRPFVSAGRLPTRYSPEIDVWNQESGYTDWCNRVIGNNVKRYLKLLAIYVLIAVALVVIYAPWGLYLRPSDYSILRAGMSIVSGVALGGVFVTSTYLLLKDPDVKLLEPAEVMSEDEVLPVLEEYENTPYVGAIAASAEEQVQSATRKEQRLTKLISVQFAEGSLSYDRFKGLAERAAHTVIRNSALIANYVQNFDRDEYAKELARKKAKKGQRSEELVVFDQTLADMQEILDANDQVLLEMSKLEREVGRLNEGDTLESADETVEELKELIEQTRYYH